MHPRNHKQMKRPRPLKAQPQLMIQPRTIPKQHRIQHPGIIHTQPHHPGQHPVRPRPHQPQHPPRSPALRLIKPALQTGSPAPQPHHLRSLHIRMNPNPLSQQIIRILPGPRIPIPLRHPQPHRSLHQIPTPQIRHTGNNLGAPSFAPLRRVGYRAKRDRFLFPGPNPIRHHVNSHPTRHPSHPSHIRRNLLHLLHLQIHRQSPSTHNTGIPSGAPS